MTLAPLATAADIQTRRYDVSDTGRVTAALNAASESVRDAAGCPIIVTTSTVRVYPGLESITVLPGGPVRSITSVSVSGVTVPADQWALVDGALWSPYQLNPVPPGGVDVTYVHGYDVVPADIVDLVCELAGASLLTDGAHDPRIASEGIDDSRTGWQVGADATTSVFELPERTRAMLARRFGGGVYVTGSR